MAAPLLLLACLAAAAPSKEFLARFPPLSAPMTFKAVSPVGAALGSQLVITELLEPISALPVGPGDPFRFFRQLWTAEAKAGTRQLLEGKTDSENPQTLELQAIGAFAFKDVQALVLAVNQTGPMSSDSSLFLLTLGRTGFVDALVLSGISASEA